MMNIGRYCDLRLTKIFVRGCIAIKIILALKFIWKRNR